MSDVATPTVSTTTKAETTAPTYEQPVMTRTTTTPIVPGRHPVAGNPGNAAGRTHTVLTVINGGKLDNMSPLDAAGILINEAARVGGIGYRGTRTTSPERAMEEAIAFQSGGFEAFTRVNLGERALSRAGDASTALRYAVNGGGLFAALAALASAHAAGSTAPALEVLARLTGAPSVREAAGRRIGKGLTAPEPKPKPEQPEQPEPKPEPEPEQPAPEAKTKAKTKMPTKAKTKGGKTK